MCSRLHNGLTPCFLRLFVIFSRDGSLPPVYISFCEITTDTIVYQWFRTSGNDEVLLAMIPHPGIEFHRWVSV